MDNDDAGEKLPFRGFDSRGALRIYSHGLLPHWRQSACTYFVTFRLADSIPQAVLDEWEEEKLVWLRKFGVEEWSKEAFAAIPPAERHRIERHFARLVNECLDGGQHGACVLRDPECAQVVAAALRHFHPLRVITGDFVVMPNHVHALMRPQDGEGFELEDVLQSVKSFTATKINKLTGESGVLWQKESYDHIVRDEEQLLAFQRYIRANPQKAKLREGEFLLREAEYDLPGL